MGTASQRVRDEWLALRCQAREAGAFEELILEMESPLLYYVAKLLNDESRALDVLQEVWLSAYHGISASKSRRHCESGFIESLTGRPWTACGPTFPANGRSARGPSLKSAVTKTRSTPKTQRRFTALSIDSTSSTVMCWCCIS